jgi:hypothetical protein
LRNFIQSVAFLVVAGLAFCAPASGRDAGATLTLKPVVQVAAEEVRLRDVVVDPGDTDFPGNMVICHAPNAGTVRTIGAGEIAAILKKHDAGYLLRGAEQVSVMRAGRRVTGADLLPLITAALGQDESKTKVHDVQLQATIFLSDVTALRLRKLRFDPAIQKYRAWFAASSAPHAAMFEAMATLEPGSAPLQLSSSNKEQISATSSVLVHRGEPAAMQLDGEGFSATLSVVCLEDGKETGMVRVRESATKRIYRAQVTARGQLRAVRREN